MARHNLLLGTGMKFLIIDIIFSSNISLFYFIFYHFILDYFIIS